MAKNSLEKFTEGVRQIWGPLTSEVVAGCGVWGAVEQ